MANRAIHSDHLDLGEPTTDIVFSFVDGFVWANWPGTVSKVRLGRYGPVAAMMRDFLSQGELAERLENPDL